VTRRFATRDEGRTEVLTRAASAIAEHGYHGMTMRDLARATGRSLASFYHLFSSKEEILFELQQRAFQHLVASAEPIVGAPGEPLDRLHRFISNHVHYFVEQPDVMRVLVQEASALPPKRRAVIRALKQRYFAIGEALLRDTVKLTGKQKVSGVELERKAYCMFGMLNWIFGWYTAARHGTPDDLARTILEMTVAGASGLPRPRDLDLPNQELLRTPLLEAQGQ
jgi:AcrR family transcriptional regulator